ncbi:SphA family protein [Sphingomonas fennica]|uniref:Transporter n=1 Tax=Edaphosphingomonas fennica TaxID=114404 RepID=A0A2T4HLX1_9SPHN|nr:transporter [Sphingomonas fennica]PTD16812.1 hypothetical protein CV103_20065 [Sphingomonas fennica]
MSEISNDRRRIFNNFWLIASSSIFSFVFANPAYASEGGKSEYSAGVDSIATAVTPPPKSTILLNYNTLFEGDIFVGDKRLDGSHVEAYVSAFRLVHSWPVSLDGGKVTFTSQIVAGVGTVNVKVPTPGGSASRSSTGFTDPILFPIAVNYNDGRLSASLSTAVWVPLGTYNRGDPINTGLGTNHFTIAPAVYVTYRPTKHVNLDITSVTEFNTINRTTRYESGSIQTFTFGASYVKRRLQIGPAAYYSTQFTDDRSSGVVVPGGNRSRVLGVGAQGFLAIGHGGISFAYFRDTLVRNRAGGNNFWLKFGVPL